MDSRERYPAFVAGWGTGKTMFAILKGLALSEDFPGNRGLIIRKNFVDLRDSTMKDFTEYTGIKIPSNKTVIFPNKSEILFRHADELAGILQNVNLGWFLIEQAEEFATNDIFLKLSRGRLRKANVPFRQAFIIANTNGHNWIWKDWKVRTKYKEKYPLWEATPFDNPYLPTDFVEELRTLKEESLSHYNRFVMNSWEETDVDDQVIPWNLVYKAIGYNPVVLRERKIISCDPADMGKDETVIYGIHNGKLEMDDIFREADTFEIADRIMQMAYDLGTKNIVIDPINNPGLRDVLMKKALTEKIHLILADNRRKATCEDYFNLRTEIWFTARKRFQTHTVSLPDHDTMLQEELACVRYKMLSDKKRKLDSKDQIRKADYLGHSPSRADALVNGLWAEEMVEPDDGFEGYDTECDEAVRAESYAIKSVF